MTNIATGRSAEGEPNRVARRPQKEGPTQKVNDQKKEDPSEKVDDPQKEDPTEKVDDPQKENLFDCLFLNNKTYFSVYAHFHSLSSTF